MCLYGESDCECASVWRVMVNVPKGRVSVPLWEE